MRTISASRIGNFLPVLDREANKYSRGICELIVGTSQYPGAGILATRAANRLGAGYVRAYTSNEAAVALRVVQPSTVCMPMDDFAKGKHESKPGRPLAVVVGCGFPRELDEAMRCLQILELTNAPVVVDGGALYALEFAQAKEILEKRYDCGYATVITPHAGEAKRLLKAVSNPDEELVDVRNEPAKAAEALAKKLKVVCVMKGPQTYIAYEKQDGFDIVDDMPGDFDEQGAQPNGAVRSHVEMSVFTQGRPSLAKAGTGDVLAGCIGALLSCGIYAPHACEAAVYLHASAADFAAREVGDFCVTPEDVVENLGKAFQTVDRFEVAASMSGNWPTIAVDDGEGNGAAQALNSLYE